jgi:hypothetical protein
MKTVTILLFFLFVGCAFIQPVQQTGFNITFHNDTNKTVIYRLARIDHQFNYPAPVEFAVGELSAGSTKEINSQYPYGLWSITWTECRTEIQWRVYREHLIILGNNNIISTPAGETGI